MSIIHISYAQLLSGKEISFSENKNNSPDALTRILFIFDDSYSMYGKWNSGMKIEIAQKLMGEFLDSIQNVKNLEIALRCYGHQTPYRPKRDCQDTKLEVPFAPVSINAQIIKNRILKLTPTGTTPIAYSLEQCVTDFPKDDRAKNCIILITDGLEECGGDPCAISKALQSKNIFLRPFVIGIGLDIKFADAFSCIGKFYDVSNELHFKNSMRLAFIEATTQTTAQINLNNIFKKPVETDVTMTLFNQKTGKLISNYVHTINNRGNPDTLILDPELTYKIVVRTVPEVIKENVILEKGKHNTIIIDAPQGFLQLKFQSLSALSPVKFVVRKKNDLSTLNVQESDKIHKYLVGQYDLEILTLPRINIDALEIKQSSINTIQIPGSGELQLYKNTEGWGSIYLEENNKLTWIYSIGQGIESEVVYLQPGNYRAEYRLKSNLDADKTFERKFIIESGKTTNIKLY